MIDVEEVAGAALPQPVDVERRRPAIAALHDHAVALAGQAVAGRAVDVVALPAALQHRHRRSGTGTPPPAGRSALPGVEQLVLAQLAPRDRARDRRARRAPSAKKSDGLYGVYFGWSCMSCRQPAASQQRQHSTNRASIASALVLNGRHLARAERSRKRARAVEVELRVGAPRCTGRTGRGSPARSAAR